MAGAGRAARAPRPARRGAVHPRAVRDHVPRAALDDASVRRVRFAQDTNARYRYLLGKVRPRCRSPSTCRPSSATTPITRGRAPRSAGSASRSTPSTTWWTCSTGCRSTGVGQLHHQRDRADHPGHLPGRGRAAGRRPDIAGTLQNDILKEFLARKTYIFPPGQSMRLVVRRGRVRHRRAAAVQPDLDHRLPRPRGRLRRVPGARVHDGLGHRVLRMRYARGMAFDEFAPRLSFHFATTLDLFEEVAKLRAARRMWHRIATERFGASDPERRPAAVLLGLLGDDPDRAAAAQQRDALHDAVPGRGARRRAVDPRHGLRRGVGDPERGGGARWRFAPSRSSPRERSDRDGRPARRVVLRRARSPTRWRRGRGTSLSQIEDGGGAVRPSRRASRSAGSPSPPTGPSARSPTAAGQGRRQHVRRRRRRRRREPPAVRAGRRRIAERQIARTAARVARRDERRVPTATAAGCARCARDGRQHHARADGRRPRGRDPRRDVRRVPRAVRRVPGAVAVVSAAVRWRGSGCSTSRGSSPGRTPRCCSRRSAPTSSRSRCRPLGDPYRTQGTERLGESRRCSWR